MPHVQLFQRNSTEQSVEHQYEHELIHLIPGKNKQRLALSIFLLKFACICNRESELNEPQYSKPGHSRALSPQPSCFYFLIGLTSKHDGAQPSQCTSSFKTSSEVELFLKSKSTSRTFWANYEQGNTLSFNHPKHFAQEKKPSFQKVPL